MAMRTLKNLLLLLSLFVVASAALVGGAAAQGPRYLDPEKLERATAPDDQGLEQWKEWQEIKCQTCKGVGKTTCVTCARFGVDAENCPECKRVEKLQAPCRVCAGKGTIPDFLESAPCAGCMGAGFWLCATCGGGGRLKVGAAKRWSACPSCRGTGGFPCTGCEGKRVMTSLDVKPSLKEAPADKLKKALKELDVTMKKFAKFTPVGGTKARKAVKELSGAFDSAKKLHPAFKELAKQSKDYMGKIFAGANFQGHEQTEADTMKRIKETAEYYLKHQKRMMELALKRAELNEAKAGK